MSFLVAGAVGGAVTAASGVVKTIDGMSKARKARQAAKDARNELEASKDAFRSLDTSNPYLNMENMAEDLTVNQQQAEFEKQQQMQSQANILQQTRSAAGSSGIAALAQTLASQGALAAQKSSVSIGEQEQANQAEERKEATRLQGLEISGEMMSRSMEAQKTQGLMGMAAADLEAANAARTAARQQTMEGIGQIAEGGAGLIGNLAQRKAGLTPAGDASRGTLGEGEGLTTKRLTQLDTPQTNLQTIDTSKLTVEQRKLLGLE